MELILSKHVAYDASPLPPCRRLEQIKKWKELTQQ